MAERYDLIVIGSGPGGYVAAIRAAQLGMKVACVEKDPSLGGTCLNVGCIPSKALLESSELYEAAAHRLDRHGIKVPSVALDLPVMLKRKDTIVSSLTRGIEGLFKKNQIAWLKGTGTILAPGRVRVASHAGTLEAEAKNLLIATGSVPSTLPGVELDGERVGTSTEALGFSLVPKELVVIGAGVIGLELGSVWLRLGAKVTVVEYLPEILPGHDAEVVAAARRSFERQGFDFITGAKVTRAARTPSGAEVVYEKDAKTNTLTCDRVLVAVGRRAAIERIGLETVGVRVTKGRIDVDARYETSVPGIWAVGDAIKGPMLAHKASEEGVAAVENMAGHPGHVEYSAIPSIVYTHPELASVGKTEEQLKAEGLEFKKGKFNFLPNGRARALGEADGFVKLLADAKTDRLLGAHIIGARAGDLIAELALAMEFKASAEDLARSIHAHPTLAEIVKEAALGVDGRMIHA